MMRFTLLLFLSFVAFQAWGAEFLRKQTGTTTIPNGSTSVTVPISGVNMTQSFLVFSSTLNSNATTSYQIGGEVTNSTTLTFERTGNAGDVTIKWQVFEFQGGVNVQHGSSTNVARNTNVNIAINCIDLTKSFVIVSGRKSGSQLGSDDGVTANLTTTTNLQLFVTGPDGADYEEVYWQVIEYQAATVKKVTATLNAGSASTTSNLTAQTGSPVSSTAKTMVISSHRVSADINADDLPRTELTSTNLVTYTRIGTTGTMVFVTYVIEFTDQSTVSRGTASFTNTTSEVVAITAGASSGVIAPGNYGRQGSTSFNTDDNTGYNWFTYEITSSTTLQVDRAIGASSTASAPWQIVAFEDLDIPQTTFYSRTSGAWESNLTWSFTPNDVSGAVPSGVYPRRWDNVVIQNGHTVTVNSVTDNGPCSQSPSGLGLGNVGPFTGSGDQMFYHTGDIVVSTGGIFNVTEEIMLAGYTLVENGGTFSINEDIVNLGYLEIATTATFANTDDLILSGNSTTEINNTSTSLDDIYLDHTDALLCGSGAFNIGGDVDPTVDYLNGATSAQICSSLPVTCTDTTPPCVPFAPPSGNFSFGKTGPGGVGATDGSSEIVLWLDANTISQGTATPLTTWTDLSGYGNDATSSGGNRPVFNANQINGFPAVQFVSSSSDYMQIADDASLDATAVSLFTVGNLENSSTAYAGFISKIQAGVPGFNGYALLRNNAAQGVTFAINALGNESVGNISYGTNTLLSGIYPYPDIQLLVNENIQTNFTYASSINTHNTPMYVGGVVNAAGTAPDRFLEGDISEIIVANSALNDAKRIIIDNYLSGKYAISIAASGRDVYTMDDNGNYDYEIAGIGQAANGTNHKDARGTGIVRMWNPKNLGNGEFLMWGHDNTAITSVGGTVGVHVDGTVIEERLLRIWRVGESGDVGNISISFDFSSIGGSPLGSNLRLLIDRDDDGFADNDVTPLAGTVSNGIAVFSNVNFQTGDRFTLGNTDASVSLPIELISFDADLKNGVVQLRWSTATELNNDFFSIERSPNAIEWQDIQMVAGSGNSQNQSNYQTTDDGPLKGESYYRLRQTDFDGTFTHSHVVKIVNDINAVIQLYPNPNNGSFTILHHGNPAYKKIRLLDLQGREIPIHFEETERLTTIRTQAPAGLYILQVTDSNSIRTIKVVINP